MVRKHPIFCTGSVLRGDDQYPSYSFCFAHPAPRRSVLSISRFLALNRSVVAVVARFHHSESTDSREPGRSSTHNRSVVRMVHSRKCIFPPSASIVFDDDCRTFLHTKVSSDCCDACIASFDGETSDVIGRNRGLRAWHICAADLGIWCIGCNFRGRAWPYRLVSGFVGTGFHDNREAHWTAAVQWNRSLQSISTDGEPTNKHPLRQLIFNADAGFVHSFRRSHEPLTR